jgi:hypothetical protein
LQGLNDKFAQRQIWLTVQQCFDLAPQLVFLSSDVFFLKEKILVGDAFDELDGFSKMGESGVLLRLRCGNGLVHFFKILGRVQTRHRFFVG